MTDIFERLKAERENRSPVVKWFYSKSYLHYNGWYWVTHPWRLPIETFKHIKRVIRRFKQRGERGFADEDTWSLDYFILSWLPEAIEIVADTSYGFPSNYGFSDEEIKDSHEDNPWQQIDSDFSYDAWTKELKEIAENLKETREQHDDFKLDQVKFEETWDRLGKIFFDLWT